MVDIHSHILPGIDDGAKSLEQSKEMLRMAWEQGISEIIATPHYMPGRHNATPIQVREATTNLQQWALEQGMPLTIYSGNEIYYHGEVLELLERGEVLTLADSDCVLVEFSPADDFRYIRNGLMSIQSVGFIPVLAHVERYADICEKKLDRIQELHDMGVLIQVNAGTLLGRMGRKARSFALEILKSRMADFVGTDAHDLSERAPCMAECFEKVKRKCKGGYAEYIFASNARTLILNHNQNNSYARE